MWESASRKSILNREVYKAIAAEAKAAGLVPRYHVYASIAPYTGSGIEFYKIPDKVLEQIGFNPRSDAFNNEEVEVLGVKSFPERKRRRSCRSGTPFCEPSRPPTKGQQNRGPFFQALSALTGAGKTPILAQAVALMRGLFRRPSQSCFGCPRPNPLSPRPTPTSRGGKY